MKTKLFSTLLTLLFFSTQFLLNTFAEDYTRLNLPEGANARLGKGVLNDMQISPDGTKLAIASSIGVWLYDINTGDETALLSGHTDAVMHVEFSRDSKMLASSANDKTIRLWDVKTGEILQTLSIPKGTLSSLKFLPDGKTLVGVNWQGIVFLWKTITGELLNTFSPKYSTIRIKGSVWTRVLAGFVDRIGVVTFAIGNKDGTISIQNGQTGKEVISLKPRTDDSQFFKLEGEPTVRTVRPMPIDDKEYHTTYMDDGTPFPIQYQLGHHSTGYSSLEEQPIKWLTKLEFSPDGKTLVGRRSYRIPHKRGWSESGGPIEIWDFETGQQLAALRSDRVQNVTFSNDGKILALAGYGGCVIWDLTTYREIATFPDAETLTFAGDERTLVLINKNSYTLWDISTHREIAKFNPIFEELKPFPERFVLSQDGAILATANEHGIVNVWQTQTDKPLLTLTSGYTKPLAALVFSHDGKTLASGDITGNIQLWDTNKHRKRMTIKTDNNYIRMLAFAKTNKTLLSESRGNITAWDIPSGMQENAYTIPDALGGSISASFKDGTRLTRKKVGAFTPNSEKLVIQTKNGTEIWDILNAKNLSTSTKIRKYWTTPAFDGKMLATASGNATRLWNTNTDEEVATLQTPKGFIDGALETFNSRNFNVYSLAFTPDGKTLAVGTGNKEIHLWDVTTRQLIKTISGHQHTVCELAFSPDGTILASGDTGGKIHLWEFATRRHLKTYETTKGFIHKLAFSPDGKTLASMNESSYRQDGTIFLWNVPSK
ncbi:MAG: WD40 repeat domain-containing protein [Candidatus Poribacteria bacterium]|nr:WD40 repeat domain-containing protein [Candidatus Poribacteria bacterium]